MKTPVNLVAVWCFCLDMGRGDVNNGAIKSFSFSIHVKSY